VLRFVQRIILFSHLTLSAFLASCSGGKGTVVGGGGGGGQPSYSPQMVFMMPTNGGVFPPGTTNIPWEVVIMNLDGSRQSQLTSDGKFHFLPHFSPDGTKVVYTRFSVGGYGDPNARSDIALYDLPSSTEKLLTSNGGASQATFSPDGSRIAYESGAITQSPGVAHGLYVMNADGSNPTLIGQASGDRKSTRLNSSHRL